MLMLNCESNSNAYPTNWVSREDLVSSRPDLTEAIGTLEEWEIERLAKQIGDHLTETYGLVLDVLLTKRFGDVSAIVE